ncbi:DUF29 domain-containing protein [Brevundimonas sp.]|jgi:hypothetical protein|uniref:DUF29 domain-containing protein n=1 Tax=Brevundimonas sp. TaxID=1871086 RepID=UPI00378447CF
MADDLQKPPVSGSDLYERDYLAWTEVQASALRARRGGENALDYDNLAEEIEDLGKSEYRACESQIENILEHLLKIEFIGPVETIPHWRGEIAGFRHQLSKRLTATIENRVRPELDDAFAYAVKSLETRGLLERATVLASRSGYDWTQVVDSDWYPEPRYGGS